MWQDYEACDLICVQARRYKGGIATLVKIAQLCDTSLDTRDQIVFEGEVQEIRTFIVFCVHRLSVEERQVLCSLLAEQELSHV